MRRNGVVTFLPIAFVVAILAAPLAHTAERAANLSATITRTPTGFRVTYVNSGDQPALCVGLLLDGVQVLSATGPPGVLTRFGTFEGRGLVHMQGTATTPAIPPGGTVNVDFTTSVPIPTNAGGEIRYSETCQPGSDKTGRASGPAATPPPPPPPPPKKCACTDLKTKIVPNRLLVPSNTANGMTLEVLVEWTLTCSKGAGTCKGQLQLVPSARAKRLKTSVSPAANVSCEGPCAKKTTRFQKFVVTAGPRYGAGRRGDSGERLLRLEMKRVCKSRKLNQIFYIAFSRTGAVDRSRSDLDANGIDDRA